jgi:hypothetical protein
MISARNAASESSLIWYADCWRESNTQTKQNKIVYLTNIDNRLTGVLITTAKRGHHH